jgi:hypothetical protein
MSRRTRLEFEPLSLVETAKQLGIPQRRAQRILTLIGADLLGSQGLRLGKHRAVRHKLARKTARTP